MTKKQKVKKTLKRVTQARPVYGYAVVNDSRTWVTRSATEDQWDAGDTETEHHVRGVIRLAGEDDRKSLPYFWTEIPSTLDLHADDTAYLVYVTYSTGDSFHHAKNECFTPIALFDARSKAEVCAASIETHAAKQDPNGPYELRTRGKYVDNDGVEKEFYASWLGYFEQMTGVEVEKVDVLSERQAKRYA
jgi:hypothetical protein